MMRRALLLVVLILGGCVGAPAENPPCPGGAGCSPPPTAPPDVLADAQPETIAQGEHHYVLVVREDESSTGYCCEDGPRFELRHAANLTVEVSWTTPPAGASEVRMSLGVHGGGLLIGPTGPSPLSFRVENASAGTYAIFLRPAKDPPAAAVDQTFSWRAIAS